MSKIKEWVKTKFTEIKNTPRKTKIVFSAFAVSFLSLGALGGYFIGKRLFEKGIDYNSLNANSYEDDNTALMSRFGKANLNQDLTTNFTYVDLANITIEKMKGHDYISSKQYGTITANVSGIKVNQTVRASSIKNKDHYFLENISASSMVQAGKRFYQYENEVKTYDGQNVQTETATWTEDKCETLNIEQHQEKWGKDLTRPLIYIISSKTIIGGQAESTSSGYKITLEMNPVLSVLNYVKQMISISGVENPTFNTLKFEINVDKQMNMVSFESFEDYSVVMVAKANTTADLIEYFTYDVETQIPDLNTNITY